MDEGADWSFCVLSRDATGAEEARTFDAVLDCTGVDAANNWTAAQPDFYILGTKAAQPGAPFLMTDAFDQIRHAFTIIGDRKALDLYASTSRLVR